MKNKMKLYEEKFGEKFPESYFEYMRERGFDEYTEKWMFDEISVCLEVNKPYKIDDQDLESYELYLAEKEYTEKFGVSSPSYFMPCPEKTKLLKEATHSGNPLQNDPNADY